VHDTECATGHINANFGTPDPDTVYSSHLNNPIRLDFLAIYGISEIRKFSIDQINTGRKALCLSLLPSTPGWLAIRFFPRRKSAAARHSIVAAFNFIVSNELLNFQPEIQPH